jgi:hypothetical protein
MEKEELYGIYVPPNIRHGDFTHFVFDNIGWREKTPDGTTFHTTSALMIQHEQYEANGNTSANDVTGTLSQGHFSMGVSTSKTRQKPLQKWCNKTRSERKSAH